MAMVDQRAVLLSARRKFLTLSDLPADIQYDGVRFPDGPPSDKLFINERLRPLEQFQAAFRVSQAEGIVTYEIVAPANRPAGVRTALRITGSRPFSFAVTLICSFSLLVKWERWEFRSIIPYSSVGYRRIRLNSGGQPPKHMPMVEMG